MRLPEVHRILTGDPREVLAGLAPRRGRHVVLVTRGHRLDADCLRIALGMELAYLGMIGSRRRVRRINEWLAEQGKQVTIIENLPEIAGDMEVRTRKMMLARLDSHRVEIICQTIVEGLGKGSVICRQGGLRFEIGGVDNLVLALGYKTNTLPPQVSSKKIHRIGDCVHPRRAIEAVHEGFLLGVEL